MDAALVARQVQAARRARAARFPSAEETLILLDDEPVGALVTARRPGVLELIDIAILPGQRGRGIGTAVLGHLTGAADRAGRAIRASVYRTNPRAHALYRRLGFVDLEGDALLYVIERPPRSPRRA